jgi:hypothetical protein
LEFLSAEQQVELDLAYIRTRSLLLDAQILLRTVPAVLSGRGAHSARPDPQSGGAIYPDSGSSLTPAIREHVQRIAF